MGFELMILAGVAYMLEVSGALAGVATVAAIGGAAVVGSAVGLAIKDARDPSQFRSPSPYGPVEPPRPPTSDQTLWDIELRRRVDLIISHLNHMENDDSLGGDLRLAAGAAVRMARDLPHDAQRLDFLESECRRNPALAEQGVTKMREPGSKGKASRRKKSKARLPKKRKRGRERYGR